MKCVVYCVLCIVMWNSGKSHKSHAQVIMRCKTQSGTHTHTHSSSHNSTMRICRWHTADRRRWRWRCVSQQMLFMLLTRLPTHKRHWWWLLKNSTQPLLFVICNCVRLFVLCRLRRISACGCVLLSGLFTSGQRRQDICISFEFRRHLSASGRMWNTANTAKAAPLWRLLYLSLLITCHTQHAGNYFSYF